MYLLRRFAVLLAFILPATFLLQAQDSSSSTSAPAPAPQDQTEQQQPAQSQAQGTQNTGQMSVQARIRARREQRRAQAIHDTYSHLYEVFIGGGYIRFRPGPDIQQLTMYSWDAAITRYFNERLGATIDSRGYYGTAYVGLNEADITRPSISQYGILGGPVYRFRLRPRYSLSAHALGGLALNDFTGDIQGQLPQAVGLYPNTDTFAVDVAIIGEANISPNLSLRLSGDYYGTGFGSTMQNSPGFTYGFVYRFGKQ
jgi:hypothetical protein